MRSPLLALCGWALAGCTPTPAPPPAGSQTSSSSATAPASVPAGSSATRSHRWTRLSIVAPDLEAQVAKQARAARSVGLTPIVHIRTHWNSGIHLNKHKADAAVQRALQGFALIEIDYADTCPTPDCEGAWIEGVLCGTYAQTFHAVSADGKPALPSATPGKFGPHTAAGCARMIEDYTHLLSRWEHMHPDDRTPCAELQLEERASLPDELPEVDVCGPHKDTKAHLERLLAEGGPERVQASLAGQMKDAVALRVCAGGEARVLRASYVQLAFLGEGGAVRRVLGTWGRQASGTTWWRQEAQGKGGRLALIVSHLR